MRISDHVTQIRNPHGITTHELYTYTYVCVCDTMYATQADIIHIAIVVFASAARLHTKIISDLG